MTSPAVIVPVKSSGGKSRLSPLLTPRQRRNLSMDMFKGVLGALDRAGLIGATRVVSSDTEVLDAASKLGARPVREATDSGVNAAVREGVKDAKGARDFLVLPSDLPYLRAEEILDLLKLRDAGVKVVVSPSAAFDGTNALLFPRTPRFPLSFDSDSFWNHLRGAAALGVRAGVFTRDGMLFDVDSPDDFRKLRSRGRGGGAR